MAQRNKKASKEKTEPTTKKLEWLPDWRDSSQYPDPKVVGLGQWQWEFVRRNKDYQKDVDKFFELLQSKGRRLNDDELIEAKALGEIGEECRELFDIPGSTELKHEMIVKWGMPGVKHYYGNTFDGKCAHPDSSYVPQFFENPKELITDLNHFEELKVDKRYNFLAIDLHAPLKPQIEVFERELRNNQKKLIEAGVVDQGINRKKSNKRPSTVYLQHLRVYDGIESKASHSEIAKVIFPDTPSENRWKAVEDSYKSAVKLISSEYKYIY